MRLYHYYLNVYQFAFNIQDILLGLVVLFLIIIASILRVSKESPKNPLYRNYMPGVILKMTGTLVFVLIYAIYYKDGGDTLAYWYGAEALKNVFYEDPVRYFQELFADPSLENFYNRYNDHTGYPPFWLYRSSRHFFVCKITSIFSIFIPGSFLGVSFLVGFICFNALWRLYLTATNHFPEFSKSLKFGILFLPSTLFWCSGIMKDTFALAGICFIVYETNKFLKNSKKRKYLPLVLTTIFWGWVILSSKPYILIAFVPSWLLWLNYNAFRNLKNKVMKYFVIPLIFTSSIIVGVQFYATATSASEFSPDTMVERAMVVRNDFNENKTYGSNRYQATTVKPELGGIITVVPEALLAGLFRPFIWEARSPILIPTGIENFFILLYFLYSVYKLRFIRFYKLVKSNPFLLFSILFALILAFIVGFTAIVFGTLVRLRTPMLPFFTSFIIIVAGKIRTFRLVYKKKSGVIQ